ncbi:ZIP family metal transporter [Candidatus Woesearchaeota archaeon]|nr:ZIP family metal transporter [Candidatus Woesearchaeota archaeon]MBW3021762.1 ZIP family metal transporter [Candidatus Woesearchaeota archaeon]
MLEIWLYSIISVIVVSLISFIGIFALALKRKSLDKLVLFLVSFAAGALFGGAILHLLPEIVEEAGFGLDISAYFLSGILIFFILEKFIHWRHCHKNPEVCEEHSLKHKPRSVAYMIIVGDGVHNFIDGMVIAASYLLSIPLGIATTLAVLFHEIPQEIGDFGVLVHGGFTKKKALVMNFLSALTAVIGAVVILIVGKSFTNITLFLIPFTAGGFIYIAGSDLIPELHRETKISKSLLQFTGIIIGILVMVLLLIING